MNLEQLSKCGKIHSYKDAEIICIEGHPGSTAYLLLRGKADVIIGSFADRSKKVAEIPTGAMFGEMSLLEDKNRTATVIANGNEVTVLEISKDDFLLFMKTDPELAYNLLRTMLGRIENIMNNNQGILVAYNAEIRRNNTFNMISKLEKEQFVKIVETDDQHALKLLKYLSHLLSDIDKKVVEIGNK